MERYQCTYDVFRVSTQRRCSDQLTSSNINQTQTQTLMVKRRAPTIDDLLRRQEEPRKKHRPAPTPQERQDEASSVHDGSGEVTSELDGDSDPWESGDEESTDSEFSKETGLLSLSSESSRVSIRPKLSGRRSQVVSSTSQNRASTSHYDHFRLPSSLFFDLLDEVSSGTESFDVEDFFGSDSDAEIIGKVSPPSDRLSGVSLPKNVTFLSLNISPLLLSALSKMAIHTPTEIQRACIPPLLLGSIT